MLTRERRDWFREDWCRFINHGLGISQWSGQEAVIRSVQRNKFTAVKSGHKVGKTHTVASLVLAYCSLYPDSRVVTTANTSQQVRENVWGEIRSQHQAATIPLGGRMLTTEWQLGPLWSAVGFSTDTPDSFQGKHAPGGTLVIFDECQGIDRDIWKASRSMMGGDNCRMLVIANPTKISGPFFDACHDPEWNVVTLSCLDHPNVVHGKMVMPGVSPDFPDLYEQDSPEWFSRVVGEFPDSDEYSLISLRMAREVEDLDPSTLAQDGIHLGVDIARFGGDSNVAALVVDRKLTSVESWRGEDLMETVGRIQHIMSKHEVPAKNVHVDVCGMGAGVVDRLRELGLRVDAVDFGAGPQEDWRGVVGRDAKFGKRRSELYWVTRQLIIEKQLHIPAEFRSIVADLTAPTYSWNSAGQIQIEAKEKIKARIGRSPDHGDALVLAMSRTGSAGPRVRYV